MMKTRIIDNVEITTDGRTVWVNETTGCCIGRFSRFGLDVHRSMGEMITGAGECLHCTHGRPDKSGWAVFQAMMKLHHNVHVMDRYKPDWVQ